MNDATRVHGAAPDDVFEGLLFYIGVGNEITSNPEDIHTAIYNLKRSGRFSIFDGFVFDRETPFPYCEAIPFAISCLKSGALIGNGFYGRYYILGELDYHFKTVTSKRFSPSQLKELERAREEFSQLVRR